MSLEDQFKQFIKDHLTNKNSVKLCDTTMISDFPQNIQIALNSFYLDPDPKVQKIGSILNGFYTQETHVCLMSVRIVNDLVKDDANLDANSCNSKTYNWIMHRLLRSEALKILREPAGKLAGLYELTNPHFLDVLKEKIGEEYLKAKKETYLEWYDSKKSEDAEQVKFRNAEAKRIKEKLREQK